MDKLFNISNKMIQILLALMLIAMVIVNMLYMGVFFSAILVLTVLAGISGFAMYQKKGSNTPLLNNALLLYLPLVLVIIGLAVRLYCIFTLDFEPYSDFKLYYDTAVSLSRGETPAEAGYLSYNGYVCFFASILAVFFNIFSASVQTAFLFNTLCQLITVLIIRQIIRENFDPKLKNIIPAIWFILPPVLFANLLISTETPFMLFFAFTLYFYLKVIIRRELSAKGLLCYVISGLLMSLTNNIRPVMLVFIIAFVIHFVLTLKTKKELLLLVISLMMFFACNSAINTMVSAELNEPLRSGAMGWSIYFGANYETYGQWSTEDSMNMSEILAAGGDNKTFIKEAIHRYQEMGFVKICILMMFKYGALWVNADALFDFLADGFSDNALDPFLDATQILCQILFCYLLLLAIKQIYRETKTGDNRTFFIELFTVGYILSNLLVVVNGRYSFPVLLLLLLIISNRNRGQIEDE